MNKFKTMLAVTTLAALTLTGTAYAANTTPNIDTPVHNHKEHEHHQVHKQKHLTEEQKKAIESAGVDLKALHAGHDQIRTEFENLHAHSKAIHDKIGASKDEKLEAQVKKDLEQFHKIMGQLKTSKQEYHALKQELRAAADSKDSAKIKATFAKIQSNQQEIIKLLQAADKELQNELTKLK